MASAPLSRPECGPIAIAWLLLAGILLIAAGGCAPDTTSLGAAQSQVPFRIRVPAASSLPPSVEQAPRVSVRKEPIPGSASSSSATKYLYVVDIDYRYRNKKASDSSASANAVSITEYQNPSGETRLEAIPTGGRWYDFGGLQAVISRASDVLGTRIVWVQESVGFDLLSTLGMDDTMRIFRSVAGLPEGDGGTGALSDSGSPTASPAR